VFELRGDWDKYLIKELQDRAITMTKPSGAFIVYPLPSPSPISQTSPVPGNVVINEMIDT